MRFLGTSGACPIPGPFCNCPICQEARLNPGLARLRSMFLLDSENLIDCGPDFVSALMRQGVNVSKLKNVFITHTHADHLDPTNAGILKLSPERYGFPVEVYLSEAAYRNVMAQYNLLKDAFASKDSIFAIENGLIHFHPLQVGENYRIGGYEIMSVDTTHYATPTETAVNFCIRKNGKSLLYACDTGLYTQQSLDLLRGAKLDYLVMEGTGGSNPDTPADFHLNAVNFLRQLDTFAHYGIISGDTNVYCSHIGHAQALNHARYQKWFEEHTDYAVTVAYDGLDIGPLG